MIGNWTKSWAASRNISHEFLAQTGSTNNLAKSSTQRGPFLFLTDHQTEGRGRGQNIWVDAKPGSCLLSSWCFDFQMAIQPIASPLVGLDLFESVSFVWPKLEWSLKAPNDLYLRNKKVAGLLLETISVGANHRFVVGLGFNITDHPNLPTAGHLTEALTQEQNSAKGVSESDWSHFLNEFWSRLQITITEITNPKINPARTQKLLVALNCYPALDKKYDEVFPDGSLRMGNTQIPWTSL